MIDLNVFKEKEKEETTEEKREIDWDTVFTHILLIVIIFLLADISGRM